MTEAEDLRATVDNLVERVAELERRVGEDPGEAAQRRAKMAAAIGGAAAAAEDDRAALVAERDRRERLAWVQAGVTNATPPRLADALCAVGQFLPRCDRVVRRLRAGDDGVMVEAAELLEIAGAWQPALEESRAVTDSPLHAERAALLAEKTRLENDHNAYSHHRARVEAIDRRVREIDRS